MDARAAADGAGGVGWIGLAVFAWALLMPQAAAAPAEAEQAPPFVYDAGGRRDPFVPLVGAGSTGSGARMGEPLLHGILWDPKGQSIALIDDIEARVGDRIGEFRVVEIRREAVVLAPEEGDPFIVELPFEPLESVGTSQPGRRDRP